MTTDTTYNGWANYETWCVSLWLGNEQGSHESMQEQARESLQNAIDNDDDKEAAVSSLAKWIEELHSESQPDLSGVFADLMNAALGAVNWREIAHHYIDEIQVYSAGWNMPGYSPDNAPALFLDEDAAMDYIREEIGRAMDETEDEELNEEQIAEFNADKNGEFGRTIGAYHYFVTRV
jgi:hypothetical protein